DYLETVQVEEENPHVPPVAVSQGDCLTHPVIEERPVGEPGESVVIGQLLDLLLGLFPFGDVTDYYQFGRFSILDCTRASYLDRDVAAILAHQCGLELP